MIKRGFGFIHFATGEGKILILNELQNPLIPQPALLINVALKSIIAANLHTKKQVMQENMEKVYVV